MQEVIEKTEKDRQFADGRGGNGGGRGAESYDRKKACSSINNSIISGFFSCQDRAPAS
jgi:hypothetical protein